MQAVNGAAAEGPPPPSPLTGCYLLVVLGEPHKAAHKDIVLQRLTKGLLSWSLNECLVDLEKELDIITEQGLEGEEAKYGERLIQFASENLVTEILIHPSVSTLAQCMRNLLSSFTKHRHIIHAGYTFAANGSWILQDGTFSYADFAEAFQENDVQRVIHAYENGISMHIHCAAEGDWTKLSKESFTKGCKLEINPKDVLTSGSPAIAKFVDYISPFLIPAELESTLESSDVVGNIRFSRPTLYVFPGGQGDAALFGINGFNMLVDGGFSRKACFWDFVRHLDRLDAVMMTRLNNSNAEGISAVVKRKAQQAVYPQIGHFFSNVQGRKSNLSPDGDKDKDNLLVNLLDEGQELVINLRKLDLAPQMCYRDSEPINLYHKVGHGTLDMYILSPAKDSREVKEFLHRWNNSDQKLFSNLKIRDCLLPLHNVISICSLLVWRPANPNDTITRIIFPGSAPQNKIFEGIDKLKNLECLKHTVCTEKYLSSLKNKSKENIIDKIMPNEKPKIDIKKDKVKPIPSENKLIENNLKNGTTNGFHEEKVKKSDSVESDKSTKPLSQTKQSESTPKVEKITSKSKIDPKIAKTKPEVKSKILEKKTSPTTPKKTLKKLINEDNKTKSKFSPSSTPAKSTKDANNRKVLESKQKIQAKKEPKKQIEKKEIVKVERKPISRRPKEASKAESPLKRVNGLPLSKKSKLDKDGTTDSSTVSSPSADQDNILRKETKMTPEEIRAQELADLEEEQEVIKELEAVFRKGGSIEEDSSDVRKLQDISIDKIEPEEYLIIEKESTVISADEENKEAETNKLARDSEESEKKKDKDQIGLTCKENLIKADNKNLTTLKDPQTGPKDPISTPEDNKKASKDDEHKEMAVESQPDEKCSANIESGATTTAPTLPEDERFPIEENKEEEAEAIEEKYVKEETKENKDHLKQKEQSLEYVAKVPTVIGLKLEKQSHLKDIIKTPDEVAELPVHEEADVENLVELRQEHKHTMHVETTDKDSSSEDKKIDKELEVATEDVKKEESAEKHIKSTSQVDMCDDVLVSNKISDIKIDKDKFAPETGEVETEQKHKTEDILEQSHDKEKNKESNDLKDSSQPIVEEPKSLSPTDTKVVQDDSNVLNTNLQSTQTLDEKLDIDIKIEEKTKETDKENVEINVVDTIEHPDKQLPDNEIQSTEICDIKHDVSPKDEQILDEKLKLTDTKTVIDSDLELKEKKHTNETINEKVAQIYTEDDKVKKEIDGIKENEQLKDTVVEITNEVISDKITIKTLDSEKTNEKVEGKPEEICKLDNKTPDNDKIDTKNIDITDETCSLDKKEKLTDNADQIAPEDKSDEMTTETTDDKKTDSKDIKEAKEVYQLDNKEIVLPDESDKVKPKTPDNEKIDSEHEKYTEEVCKIDKKEIINDNKTAPADKSNEITTKTPDDEKTDGRDKREAKELYQLDDKEKLKHDGEIALTEEADKVGSKTPDNEKIDSTHEKETEEVGNLNDKKKLKNDPDVTAPADKSDEITIKTPDNEKHDSKDKKEVCKFDDKEQLIDDVSKTAFGHKSDEISTKTTDNKETSGNDKTVLKITYDNEKTESKFEEETEAVCILDDKEQLKDDVDKTAPADKSDKITTKMSDKEITDSKDEKELGDVCELDDKKKIEDDVTETTLDEKSDKIKTPDNEKHESKDEKELDDVCNLDDKQKITDGVTETALAEKLDDVTTKTPDNEKDKSKDEKELEDVCKLDDKEKITDDVSETALAQKSDEVTTKTPDNEKDKSKDEKELEDVTETALAKKPDEVATKTPDNEEHKSKDEKELGDECRLDKEEKSKDNNEIALKNKSNEITTKTPDNEKTDSKDEKEISKLDYKEKIEDDVTKVTTKPPDVEKIDDKKEKETKEVCKLDNKEKLKDDVDEIAEKSDEIATKTQDNEKTDVKDKKEAEVCKLDDKEKIKDDVTESTFGDKSDKVTTKTQDTETTDGKVKKEIELSKLDEIKKDGVTEITNADKIYETTAKIAERTEIQEPILSEKEIDENKTIDIKNVDGKTFSEIPPLKSDEINEDNNKLPVNKEITKEEETKEINLTNQTVETHEKTVELSKETAEPNDNLKILKSADEQLDNKTKSDFDKQIKPDEDNLIKGDEKADENDTEKNMVTKEQSSEVKTFHGSDETTKTSIDLAQNESKKELKEDKDVASINIISSDKHQDELKQPENICNEMKELSGKDSMVIDDKSAVILDDLNKTISPSDKNLNLDINEIKTEEVTVNLANKPEHAESVVLKSSPESPVSQTMASTDFKDQLNRKSPKEREEDVAKIVASVAEVLKSDAPLEEFHGKLPFVETVAFQPYTTELRETHITTSDTPVDNKQTKFMDKLVDTKQTMHEKDTTTLNQEEDQEADLGTVHRMLVTASSEDGGEETEICPPGTITFCKSSESSGRSSPDTTLKRPSKNNVVDSDLSKVTVQSSVKNDVISNQEGLEKAFPTANGFIEELEDHIDNNIGKLNKTKTENITKVNLDGDMGKETIEQDILNDVSNAETSQGSEIKTSETTTATPIDNNYITGSLKTEENIEELIESKTAVALESKPKLEEMHQVVKEEANVSDLVQPIKIDESIDKEKTAADTSTKKESIVNEKDNKILAVEDDKSLEENKNFKEILDTIEPIDDVTNMDQKESINTIDSTLSKIENEESITDTKLIIKSDDALSENIKLLESEKSDISTHSFKDDLNLKNNEDSNLAETKDHIKKEETFSLNTISNEIESAIILGTENILDSVKKAVSSLEESVEGGLNKTILLGDSNSKNLTEKERITDDSNKDNLKATNFSTVIDDIKNEATKSLQSAETEIESDLLEKTDAIKQSMKEISSIADQEVKDLKDHAATLVKSTENQIDSTLSSETANILDSVKEVASSINKDTKEGLVNTKSVLDAKLENIIETSDVAKQCLQDHLENFQEKLEEKASLLDKDKQALTDQAAAFIKSAEKEVESTLTSHTTNLLDSVKNVSSTLEEKTKENIQKTEMIVDNKIKNITEKADDVKQYLKNTLENVQEMLEEKASVLEKEKDKCEDQAVTLIKSTEKEVESAITSHTSNLFDSAKETASLLEDNAKEGLYDTNVFLEEKIKNIAEKTDDVKQYLEDTFDSFQEKLKDTASALEKEKENLSDQVDLLIKSTEGVKTAITLPTTKVLDSVKEATSSMEDKANETKLIIENELHDLKDQAVNFVGSTENKIESRATNIIDSVKGVVSSLESSTKDNLQKGNDILQDILKGTEQKSDEIKHNIESTLSQNENMIITGGQNIKEESSSLFKSIEKAVESTTAGVVNLFEKSVSLLDDKPKEKSHITEHCEINSLDKEESPTITRTDDTLSQMENEMKILEKNLIESAVQALDLSEKDKIVDVKFETTDKNDTHDLEQLDENILESEKLNESKLQDVLSTIEKGVESSVQNLTESLHELKDKTKSVLETESEKIISTDKNVKTDISDAMEDGMNKTKNIQDEFASAASNEIEELHQGLLNKTTEFGSKLKDLRDDVHQATEDTKNVVDNALNEIGDKLSNISTSIVKDFTIASEVSKNDTKSDINKCDISKASDTLTVDPISVKKLSISDVELVVKENIDSSPNKNKISFLEKDAENDSFNKSSINTETSDSLKSHITKEISEKMQHATVLSNLDDNKVLFSSTDKQGESDDENIISSTASIASEVPHLTPTFEQEISKLSDHKELKNISFYEEIPDDEIEALKATGDPMSMSFYGEIPEDSLETKKVLEDPMTMSFYQEVSNDDDKQSAVFRDSHHDFLQAERQHTTGLLPETQENKKPTEESDIMTSSFIGELPSTRAEDIMSSSFVGELPHGDDPIKSWGKPLGLPSPAPPNMNTTPKKEKKIPSNVLAKNKINDDKKRSESPSKNRKKVNPIYVDLTYVPHHGNSNYSYIDFFRRIRARYYVFSGIEPSKEVYNALLEAKQTWEDKELEVTIIPTYDTDVLGYWVAENEELLIKNKIDLSPSASRCTINLQDHETSCSAYRLEF